MGKCTFVRFFYQCSALLAYSVSHLRFYWKGWKKKPRLFLIEYNYLEVRVLSSRVEKSTKSPYLFFLQKIERRQDDIFRLIRGKWIVLQRFPTRCARCSSLARWRRSSRWGGICCRQSRQASTGSWFWSNLQKIPFMCSHKVFFLSPCVGPPQFRLKCKEIIVLFWTWHFFVFFYVNEFVDVELDPLVAGEVLVVLEVELEGVLQVKNTLYSCRTLNFPPTVANNIWMKRTAAPLRTPRCSRNSARESALCGVAFKKTNVFPPARSSLPASEPPESPQSRLWNKCFLMQSFKL